MRNYFGDLWFFLRNYKNRNVNDESLTYAYGQQV